MSIQYLKFSHLYLNFVKMSFSINNMIKRNPLKHVLGWGQFYWYVILKIIIIIHSHREFF